MCIELPPNDQNAIMRDSPAHLALKKLSITGSIVGTMPPESVEVAGRIIIDYRQP